MDIKKNHPLPSKIDQLVDDAKTQLNRAGIKTDGKRSDEILKMAREERNKRRVEGPTNAPVEADPPSVTLAGGHKMTDDEIREALRLDFEQTADWRRSKAAEYPEDSRNLEAAALLDKLAASVETVAPTLLDAYGSLRDDYMDSEQHSEMFRRVGFHSWPETAEDFVKACVADRAMRA